MKKRTKIAIVRILHAVALVPISYVIGSVVVRSFWSISDDNPLLAVVSTLGATSIWAFFILRLHRNIDRGTDNPYGEALAWTAERSARLVVALLMLFTLGMLVQQSIETNSYWWIAALALVILFSKKTRNRHFKEWWRGLTFLYTRAFALDVGDKSQPSTGKDDD